jgi:hypothetical protein
VHTEFRWGNVREGGHLEDPGIEWRIVLRCIIRKWNGWVMDWIDLAKNGDKWQALVNAILNLWIP